ncbi:MAG TPA: RNA polymerase Rpb4 family protein [Candidatus Thermoplasmatota archaeon]|nr:RNA polymerase Rpb4 family protein [Candidatus Thermoplasmatota archaeon]
MKIGERHLTIPEVHELLLKEQEKRELTYEQKLVLQHCELLQRFDTRTAQKLVAELEKIERVSAPLAHKIAELLPTHPDDVRSIFSKERFTLEEKTIASIMQTVGKYGAAATAPPSE